MRHLVSPSAFILLVACSSSVETPAGGGGSGGDAPAISAGSDGAGSGGAGGPTASGTGGAGAAGSGSGGRGEGGSGGRGEGGSGGRGEGGSGGSGGDDAPDCSGASAAVAGDVLDPEQVYLAGTLLEGICGQDAVVHWGSPGSAAVGFDCDVNERSAQILPAGGRLLYINVFEDLLREFRCDGCPYDGDAYPAAPLENDAVLSTPPCDPESDPLASFLVSPAGTVLHRCRSDLATWYDERGAVVHADPDNGLLHLGHGDLALTEQSVIHLATSTSMPIVGLPSIERLHTARAKAPDRFLLVLGSEAPSDDGSSQELWEVDGRGNATRLGVFPPLPAEATEVSASTSKLDGCGALLQFGGGPGIFEDVIVRREIGGVSEVVYTEATDPLVKIHISALFTGP